MTDLYETLNVPRNADKSEIKKAYRNKAKQAHPDRGGDNDNMAAIALAYEVLNDEKKRERYDRTGQTREIAFDQFFADYMEKLVMQIIEQIDRIDSLDMIKEIKKHTQEAIRENENRANGIKNKISKIDRFLVRLKPKQGQPDKMKNFLTIRKAAFENDLNIIKENISNLTKCLAIVSDYRYEFESKNHKVNTVSFFTATGD